MIDVAVRSKIQLLRSEGKSYAEICGIIGFDIPKGTLSYICKNVKLPEVYYANKLTAERVRLVELRKKALIANRAIQKHRETSIYERAIHTLMDSSSLNNQKIQLAMLYKGEGSKYNSGYHGLALANSDSKVLRTYIALLERCFGIARGQFRFRIMSRADQDLNELHHYWAEELSVPLEHFYKPYSDVRTAGKPTKRLNYKGVCVVSCKGADIQLELDAIANLYSDKLWGISSFG